MARQPPMIFAIVCFRQRPDPDEPVVYCLMRVTISLTARLFRGLVRAGEKAPVAANCG